MRAHWRKFRQAVNRHRHDVITWAIAAAAAASISVIGLLVAVPWLAIPGAAVGALIRLARDIGRRERTAHLEQRLRNRATVAVGDVVQRLVLERTLWHDEKASEAIRARFIDTVVAKRFGRQPNESSLVPYVMSKSWSLEDVIQSGEDQFDVTRHEAGDWLNVGGELKHAHDDFAAAVGPYSVDLDADTRRAVSECLFWLESGKDAADRVFHVLYEPGKARPEEIGEAADTLWACFVGAHSAARDLVAVETSLRRGESH